MRKMKTTKKMKAFALTLAMALGMLLPRTMNAQSDGFFRGGNNDNSEYRDAISLGGNGMSLGDNPTQENPSPLGSGLMVMVAAGAGYVALKKKED